MKTRKSDVRLSSHRNMSSRSREASKLNGSDEGVVGLRQSHRVSNQRNFVDEDVEDVRIFVIHLLETYITMLCNWLIL